MSFQYTISLCICTYAKKNSLLRCLKSVRCQSVLPNRLIIIEKCDESATTSLNELCTIFPNIKISYVRVQGIHVAKSRNIAINKSKEDIVLFVDDDVVLDQKYIQKLLLYYQKYPKRKVVVGKIQPSKIGYWELFTNKVMTSHAIEDTKSQIVHFWPTMNLSFRKSIHVSFDERFSAMEDMDFCLQLQQKKHKIYYYPQLKCVHHYTHTLSCFCQKFTHYYIHNLHLIREKHPNNYTSPFPILNKHSPKSYFNLLKYFFYDTVSLWKHFKLPIRYLPACFIYHTILYKAVYFESPHQSNSWHFTESDQED